MDFSLCFHPYVACVIIICSWMEGINGWPCGYDDEYCTREAEYASNPANCSQYYRCIHGIWTVYDCAAVPSITCGTPVDYCRWVFCQFTIGPTTTSAARKTVQATIFSSFYGATVSIKGSDSTASILTTVETFNSSENKSSVSSASAGILTTVETFNTSDQRSDTDTSTVGQDSLNLGAIVGVLAGALVIAVVTIIILLVFYRRRTQSQRSKQPQEMTPKAPNVSPKPLGEENMAANNSTENSNNDSYMFLVKSEYIDGSDVSSNTRDYQELNAQNTPSGDVYSYASVGGAKPQDKKEGGQHLNKSVYENQQVYYNDLI